MAYKGMRWFKCDLQMQTPADKSNWRGKAGEDSDAAEAYIKRCFEVELRCIAITDHNFASKGFIDLLFEENIKYSAANNVAPIHILPGFELEADIGKGLHALVLFDSDFSLAAIDHKLTNCGVPYPRFKSNGASVSSTKNLRAIIEEVQKRKSNGRLEGLVICAHPTSEHGIFDNDSISEWLQSEEWLNSELLAVEIPKPVEQMSSGWQKLFANGSDCLPAWKRIRPIGRFMSSDCKALASEENEENYIGKRYCWVKMSVPSVESLRQASLDHESRVWFGAAEPEVGHTHVANISIKNVKFLQDQSVAFSPNLNCIIGGRGSGKSTILEYMRLALRALPQGFDERGDSAAARQIKRIRSTLVDDSLIEIELKNGALNDKILMQGSKGLGTIFGRDVKDVESVFQQFGVLAFSQDEITELAVKSSFLSLVDEGATSKLSDVRRQEAELRNELRVLFAHRRNAVGMELELVSAEQVMVEIQRQFDASAGLQGELKALQEAELSALIGERYESIATDVVEQVQTSIDGLKELAKGFSVEVDQTSAPERLNEIGERLAEAISQLSDSMQAQLVVFNEKALLGPGNADVASLSNEAGIARQALEAACTERGISLSVVAQLNELNVQRSDLLKVIDGLKKKLAEVNIKVAQIPVMQKRLSEVWESRTSIRREEVAKILESPTIPRTLTGKPILKPSVIRGGDRRHFQRMWSSHSPDGRSRLGRIWNDEADQQGIGSIIFDAYHESLAEGRTGLVGMLANVFFSGSPVGNPIWWLDGVLDTPAVQVPWLSDSMREELLNFRTSQWEAWEQMLLSWIDDSGDIQLLRADDSVAGSLSKKDLSDGQQNTAILSLLLARGDGPVLIDQPENELDSAFLFTQLVPMLRQAKQSRQLIVVTHNANIPVNADAELIYALESSGGKGVPKAEGGLDSEDVNQAVIDIMEGSTEAFRRRHEKYHF